MPTHDFKLELINGDEGTDCGSCGQDVTCLVRYRCPVCSRQHEVHACSSLGPPEEGMCTAGILDLGAPHCGDSFRAALFAHLHDLLDEAWPACGQTVEERRAERISATMGPVQGHA